MCKTLKRYPALWIVIVIVCLTQRPVAVGASNIGIAAGTTTMTQEQEDEAREKKKKKKKEEKDKEEEEKGTLGAFESEATGERPDSVQSGESGESGEVSGWWIFAGELFAYATLGGAIGSWYRVTGHPADDDLERYFGERRTGDPGLPYFGLNLSYQNVKSDVEAFDVNAESGFGPLGAHYRFTRFREEDPETELDLSWLHGVLRLSYTRYFEVGLGFGAIFFEGTGSESGFSFELPIRVEPSRYFGFDYRPVWGLINGNTISDQDLALRLGLRYVSVRGGYRWTKTGSATLKGPIIGLLLSY